MANGMATSIDITWLLTSHISSLASVAVFHHRTNKDYHLIDIVGVDLNQPIGNEDHSAGKRALECLDIAVSPKSNQSKWVRFENHWNNENYNWKLGDCRVCRSVSQCQDDKPKNSYSSWSSASSLNRYVHTTRAPLVTRSPPTRYLFVFDYFFLESPKEWLQGEKLISKTCRSMIDHICMSDGIAIVNRIRLDSEIH